MVNMAHLGLVLECDRKSLTIYHERIVYFAERTERFFFTERADWVIFKEKDRVVDLIRPYEKNKWNARINHQNDILLTVNAQVRDLESYPILKGGIPDFDVDPDRKKLAETPWSYELDDLEDELDLMAPTRRGWFHEVTIKFEYKKNEMGEYVFRFPILEIFYESPRDMQMNTQYAPWIDELLSYRKPKEMSAYKSVAERGGDTNVHKASTYLGLIITQREPGCRTAVWSLHTGVMAVNMLVNYGYHPGQFVQFTLTKGGKDVYARQVEASPHAPKTTDSINKTPDEKVARILVNFPIPEEKLAKPLTKIRIYDNYLGDIETNASKMESLLQKRGYSLSTVRGRILLVWVIPTYVNVLRKTKVYWKPESLHKDVFNLDEEKKEREKKY